MEAKVMQALLVTQKWALELQDMPIGTPGPNEVLLRVEAAGICGSDLDGVATRSPRRQPPLVMGHEIAGRVVEAGSSQGSALIGQQVAVNPQIPCGDCLACRTGRENICPNRGLIGGTRAGGFAEFVIVPLRCVHVIPTPLPPETAVLAEPLAACVHGLRLVGSQFVDTAVVFGAGTIGILASDLLRKSGVRQLIVCDIDAKRRELASAMGDRVVSPEQLSDAVSELTNGRGAELAVDAVGAASTRADSIRVLQSGGRALWLGMHDQEGSIRGFDIVVREQQVQGSFAYTDGDFVRALGLLQSGQVQPAVSTRSFPLDQGVQLLERMLAGPGEGSFVKALIRSED
jgi:2-desacetyl-2-hydroxyethyl bacteriochlorophyllide A dehydrogenase